jgi:hypothetical protein
MTQTCELFTGRLLPEAIGAGCKLVSLQLLADVYLLPGMQLPVITRSPAELLQQTHAHQM